MQRHLANRIEIRVSGFTTATNVAPGRNTRDFDLADLRFYQWSRSVVSLRNVPNELKCISI